MDIPTPNRVDWRSWGTIHVTNPYTEYLHSITNDTMIFSGYFMLEDGEMSVERIFDDGLKFYYVKILEKRTLKDTSEYTSSLGIKEYDNENANIAFFPSGIIKLKYRIIKLIEYGSQEYKDICERINRLEYEVHQKNRTIYRGRIERELMASMERRKRRRLEKIDEE
jgi:hypothetical protein